MLLDVVVLPPASFRRKFGTVGKNLAQSSKAIFVVDNKNRLPHLSLYHIKSRRVVELKYSIRKLLNGVKPFVVEPLKFGSHGTIWALSAKKSGPLLQLHTKTVKSLYKYKQGLAFPVKPVYNVLQKSNVRKYGGSPNIFKLYWPHFTLGKFQDVIPETMAKKATKNKFSRFLADTIALTQTDEEHQVIKIIKIYKLINNYAK